MHVHVVATGGTIASTATEGGARPSLDGAALVDAADLGGVTDEVTVETVAERPGFDMDLRVCADVAERVRASDADGVVVTHGTDTMEESAYALDRALGEGPPVVVTGAQRRPDEVGADGPANLRTAVRAAASDRLDRGASLAFDGELHAARPVTKAHTEALSTFTSPEAGPVASFSRGSVRWHRAPSTAGTALGPDALRTAADRDVPVVVSGSGVPRSHFERAADGADGVVLAGTGLGNATAGLGEAVADASLPVVVASRCFSGPTDAVYGTPGGAVSLAEAGVTFAGELQPWKARIGLQLALATDRDAEALLR